MQRGIALVCVVRENVVDRVPVDGFYYAAFLKYYKRLIQHPEVLDEAPAEIVKDMD